MSPYWGYFVLKLIDLFEMFHTIDDVRHTLL